MLVRRKRRPKFQPKPGELVVSRRLFRSGESEYLFNGKHVRLRDVQDIFFGTGLGPDTYAIIEQGRVGLILSSKPSDRRAIIEEAAGITKFKTKRNWRNPNSNKLNKTCCASMTLPKRFLANWAP